MKARGCVVGLRDGHVHVRMPQARIGQEVTLIGVSGPVGGRIVALDRTRALVAPHDATDGLCIGDAVESAAAHARVPIGSVLLGRVVDAQGSPLDDAPPMLRSRMALRLPRIDPAQRLPVDRPCWSGVRALDALLCIGVGARIGVFGPPGAGKTTLLHAIARGVRADAVVIAAVGERGREVQEWMQQLDARTCMICATGDRSAAARRRAAEYAFAQAHALRERGLHVLLILDSLARVGAALRELGLAQGEPVGRGGYPASVVPELARMVEVAGRTRRGAITLVATVLSDGDERDPISDAARSLLDGHLQLCPRLAQAGRFPAIDVLASSSRTMSAVVSAEHRQAAERIRAMLGRLAAGADARALGIAPGDSRLARAVALEEELELFLRQAQAGSPPERTLAELAALADMVEE